MKAILSAMNKTVVLCFSYGINVTYLNLTHLVLLTVINVIIMVGNVILNTLVIYILTKTKQLSNVVCKVILILSMSDLLAGAVAQNLFLVVLYSPSCSINLATRTISTFSTNFSGYTTAILGVDRFVRIKYFTKVKTILTSKFTLTLISMAFLAALFNAVGIPIGLLLMKENLFSYVTFILSVTIVIIVMFLQVLVMRASNTVSNESTIDTSQTVNKKINKLSMRIMLALLFFFIPVLIISISKGFVEDLSKNLKSGLEFTFGICIVFHWANSLVNAILFLSMNTKAKRYLRDLKSRNNKKITPCTDVKK